MTTNTSFKVGDHVHYASGSVEREIYFAFAVVVEVDPSKKRVGIAIRQYGVAEVAVHREGNKIVTISTVEVGWEPKRVSPTSIHRVAEEDTGRVPPPVRSAVSVPPSW